MLHAGHERIRRISCLHTEADALAANARLGDKDSKCAALLNKVTFCIKILSNCLAFLHSTLCVRLTHISPRSNRRRLALGTDAASF